MPLFLILIGLILVISGAKGTTKELASLLKDDFAPTDSNVSFGVWIIAIVMVGALGYIPKLKPLSNAFLVLLFVGLMLSNRGFFAQFSRATKIG